MDDVKRETMQNRTLTYEYIRGLTEGEGSFTFSTNYKIGVKIPSFQIRMHVRDKFLLESVRDFLKLKNRIYIYHYNESGKSNRGPQAILIVREFGSLKNIIIPVFYRKLFGNKAIQFNEWIDKMGEDPLVPKKFKFLNMLHKSGFYEQDKSFP